MAWPSSCFIPTLFPLDHYFMRSIALELGNICREVSELEELEGRPAAKVWDCAGGLREHEGGGRGLQPSGEARGPLRWVVWEGP